MRVSSSLARMLKMPSALPGLDRRLGYYLQEQACDVAPEIASEIASEEDDELDELFCLWPGKIG